MLADSGYWLALASPRDRWHEAAVAATQQLPGPLVVTWPVITEVSYLLLTRGGVNAQTRFLDQISSHVDIHPLQRSHLPAIRLLMEKRGATRIVGNSDCIRMDAWVIHDETQVAR